MAAPARGQLLLKVLEASGESKDKQQLWDSNFVQGFVKVEIRGGSRTVKALTTQKRVLDSSLRWDEDLTLNVLEDAKELRLMLCRERKSTTSGRVSAAVTAACGIYVQELLDNVPLDKYFELFKPSSGGDGGYIHIKVDFRASEENGLHALPEQPAGYNSDDIGSPTTPVRQGRARFADQENDALESEELTPVEEEGGRRRGGGSVVRRLLAVSLLVAAAIAAKAASNRR